MSSPLLQIPAAFLMASLYMNVKITSENISTYNYDKFFVFKIELPNQHEKQNVNEGCHT